MRFGAVLALSGPFAWAAPLEFNRDVRPILSDKCFGCHGPDSGHRKAGLRLDLKEAAIQPAKSGEIPLKPGSPEESHLLERILSKDSDEVMPPPDAKMTPLTAAEIGTIKEWIKQGAEYQPLWSLIPLQTETEGKGAAKGMDELVRERLLAKGLNPRREARPEVLLRRVSLDLTGLPPSPAEVRTFLSDTKPGAYERAVERLLASPAFGERWAADWLDISRYADSFGFQVDRERSVWPWRDWVVSAFNRNLPFNEFVTWQLAGDLLPEPTEEQVLATAFNRLHQQEAEGGSIEEEYRVEYVSDRVQTFATAFLGLTFECAKCHDHKFDPISQKEFYQLFAFFDDIEEAGLYSFFDSDAAPTPSQSLMSKTDVKKLQLLKRAEQTAVEKLKESKQSASQSFEAWLVGRQGPRESFAIPDEIGRFQSLDAGTNRLTNSLNPTQSAAITGENKLIANRPGTTGQAVRLSGDEALNLPVGNFNRATPFTISLWLQMPELSDRAVVLHRSMAWTDAASKGFELLLENGHLKWSLIRFWPGDAASILSKTALVPGKWTHVAISSDGSGKAAGLSIFIDGVAAATEVLKDHLSRDINPGRNNITIGERMRDRGFKNGLVDDIRIFNRRLSPLEIAATFDPEAASRVWAKDTLALTESERQQLKETFLSGYAPEDTRAALTGLQTAREAVLKHLDTQPEISVMQELPHPKKAYVLFRGQYDQRRDEVFAGTPAALPAFPASAPLNRRGLAQWLTDPGHPLLARVTVNRFWQALFGRGLVRTSDDFGSQGSQPEYQDVLDCLSREFINSGWNVKGIIKSMVLSQTYRQESTAAQELLVDDPDNELLARGPRFRLPAEAVRDTFLSASGLLNATIGGPPVNPYELTEAFRPKAADKDSGSLRRSLYTRWQRTSPPPAMMAFDASRRAVCSARRERTNTPLQALVLLNGPQYVEAARVLGTRLHLAHGGRVEGMIEEAFLACLSRMPDPKEKEIVASLYREQLAHFQHHPEEAQQFLKVGHTPANPTVPAPEAAAATVLAQALFNHDGAIVKQ